MSETTTHNRVSGTGASRVSVVAMWASACVIAALVILQAGRLPENSAFAEMTADRGSYTLLTCDAGKGGDDRPNELLYIIDSRDNVLLVYEIEDTRRGQIVPRDGYNLQALFARARR